MHPDQGLPAKGTADLRNCSNYATAGQTRSGTSLIHALVSVQNIS